MIQHEELASVGQRMVWLIGHYRGDQGRLNYPLLLRLRGPLDPRTVRHAVDRLVARHEALRTTFARRRGLLTQLVHAPDPVPVTELDLPADRVEDETRREVADSIDPSRAPIRVTLWRIARQDHLLCLNAHHLVTDAWSCRVLTHELLRLLGDAGPLPPVPWQYRHFVRWQRRASTAARMAAAGEYWRGQLAGVRRPEVWRTDPGPADRATAVRAGNRTIAIGIGRAGGERVHELARRERTTPFAVLLAAYYLALYGVTGQQDLCVAAPFANRTRPEIAQTVGLFANLVMLRTRLDPDLSFVDLLRRTGSTVNQATAHQDFPYFQLPSDAPGARADRLDDVVFQMVPDLPEPFDLGNLQVEVMPPELDSRFGLELIVVPHPNGFHVRLQYAEDRVAGEVARRLAEEYAIVVDRITEAPRNRIGKSVYAQS
jgi:Condensation domain